MWGIGTASGYSLNYQGVRLRPSQPTAQARYLPPYPGHPKISPSATVRESSITGDVTIGPWSHIVHAIIRADEGSPFYIGALSNVQDGAVIHAHNTFENGKPVMENLVNVPGKGLFSVYIGDHTSIAHDALIHGPVKIGDNCFIGFKSTVHHATLGNHVEIGPHSYIANVTIPDHTSIRPGAIITRPEDIRRFIAPHGGKNPHIAKVNTELALAYHPNRYLH